MHETNLSISARDDQVSSKESGEKKSPYEQDGMPLRLSDLLTPETIQLDRQAANWREAVQLAGSLLLKTGAITPAYVDAMVRVVAELGPYMVVAPGIALAHARPEDGVKRACMSLVRLSSLVEFGSENDPVDLVLAFKAVDKAMHLQH